MNLMKWTEDLAVGNPLIDEDHRNLFSLLERLHQDRTRAYKLRLVGQPFLAGPMIGGGAH